jgi:peptidoglycan/LPS O-acetylase OafA/YrhL
MVQSWVNVYFSCLKTLSLKGKMKRNPLLDIARVVASLGVICVHFFGGAGGETLQNNFLSNDSYFYSLQSFSAYGFLGVDLFFMISGVVICASAVNKNATDFLRSRFIRLFPIFIAAASIAMLIGRFSQYSYNRIGFLDYLPNLLLITQATGSKLADGVYWTLFFEIRFYLLVALCLFIWGKKLNFFYFANLWLFAVVILNSVSTTPGYSDYLRVFLMPDYSPGFILGIYVYLGISTIPRHKVILPLCVSLSLAISNRVSQGPVVNSGTKNSIVALILFLSFVYILLSCWSNFGARLRQNSWQYLGRLSYPLYLTHSAIGLTTLRASAIYKIDPLFALGMGLGLSILAAVILQSFVEPRLRPFFLKFI